MGVDMNICTWKRCVEMLREMIMICKTKVFFKLNERLPFSMKALPLLLMCLEKAVEECLHSQNQLMGYNGKSYFTVYAKSDLDSNQNYALFNI